MKSVNIYYFRSPRQLHSRLLQEGSFSYPDCRGIASFNDEVLASLYFPNNSTLVPWWVVETPAAAKTSAAATTSGNTSQPVDANVEMVVEGLDEQETEKESREENVASGNEFAVNELIELVAEGTAEVEKGTAIEVDDEANETTTTHNIALLLAEDCAVASVPATVESVISGGEERGQYEDKENVEMNFLDECFRSL